jgi:hypothetical protein
MRLRISFAMPISSLLLPAGLALALAADSGAKLQEAILRPAAFTLKDSQGRGFSDGARIDNRWFPLAPGTQFVFEGRANRGHGQLRHRVVFTVTDLTKVIDGVRTLVLWDRDYNAGRLEENEITFHAQDDAGTVWNFGEYPEVYENGQLKGAPDTWVAGLEGAKAGILMPAKPRVGTPSYLQGFAPKIEFADRARVFRTGLRLCNPRACYRNVLVTDEWNPAEPGAHQRKYYAPTVGNVRVGAAGNDKEGEVLVLEEVRRLSPGSLAWVRRQVLRIDARAYRVKPRLYRHTPPAERAPYEG